MMATNATPSTLLDVRHLNVDYLAANGTVHAVTDVSFTLRRGEILGLAGESGSGKSTLAYAITRLLRPPALITGGEIRYYPGDTVAGEDVISEDAMGADAINRVPTEIDGGSIDLLQLPGARLRKMRWNELAIV